MSLGRFSQRFPNDLLFVSLDTLPGKKQGSLQGGTEGGLDTHGLLGERHGGSGTPKGTPKVHVFPRPQCVGPHDV